MSEQRDPEQDQNREAYEHVLQSFVFGFLRLFQAEAAISRLNAALIQYRSEKPDPPVAGSSFEKVFEHLHRIPYQSYDALRYVTDLSHLVYATTILDTFITDTTLFLLLLHPGAIGRNQQIRLSNILAAKSTSEVLTDAAVEKARELSYLSFEARIEYLRETFGLKLEIDGQTAAALRHYPSKRNVAVHDQGVYELRRDETGKVATRRKTCAVHPTRIHPDDIAAAMNAYGAVVAGIASAVLTQCLKTTDQRATELLGGLAHRQALPSGT